MEKYTTKITSRSVEQSGLTNDYKKAIAEYIWNGFDANASHVHIEIDSNKLGFINNFSIEDNGEGISIENIDQTFGQFLDSQKIQRFSQDGFVKGKKGRGRYSFRIFANEAIWSTCFKTDKEEYLEYDIKIKRGSLQEFLITEKKASRTKQTRTRVDFKEIFSLTGDLIENEDFYDFLTCEFGWFLYLNKSLGFKLTVNFIEVDYKSIIAKTEDYSETFGDNNFVIKFIRWKKNIGDKYYYYFLDNNKKEKGRDHTSFNNKTEDFHHSVYVESEFFDEFSFVGNDNPTLPFNTKDQHHEDFKKLMKVLKENLAREEKLFIREFKVNTLIERYRKKKIIPEFGNSKYAQLRRDDLENVIKEVYCVEPKIFQGLKDSQSKTLVGFLNLLLDSEQRDEILAILDNVVKLTDEERSELSRVLQKTKLSAVVSLVKMLEGRFRTITGLKKLVFELAKFTNERDHIQTIVENNYWMFGEQYHLVSADKNFEILLNNYLKFIEDGEKDIKKMKSENRLKRPDIFIARKMNYPDQINNEYIIEENIIVELKRPSVKIGKDQYDQIEQYIRTIIKEPRFSSELRNWKLFLVGKEIDDWILDKYESQKNKGKKFLVEAVKNYEIYALRWDDLFRLFEIKHNHLINGLEFKESVITEFKDKGIFDSQKKEVEEITQKISRA